MNNIFKIVVLLLFLSFTSRVLNHYLAYSWAGSEYFVDVLKASLRYFFELILLIFFATSRKWAYWFTFVGSGISSIFMVYACYAVYITSGLEGHPYAFATGLLVAGQTIFIVMASMMMIILLAKGEKMHNKPLKGDGEKAAAL